MRFDMRKAYDKLEREFVGKAMFFWGFSEEIQSMILSCIEMVEYSLLLNEERMGKIIPEIGIRQGNPLSHFLFILCMEVLSMTIQQNTNIQGIKICKNGPAISHLFFADDMLLACRADLKNAKAIQRCLNQYYEWSGQAMNMEKSHIFFSKNMVNKMSMDSIYLGNTLILGRNKTKEFHNLKIKIQGRLKG